MSLRALVLAAAVALCTLAGQAAAAGGGGMQDVKRTLKQCSPFAGFKEAAAKVAEGEARRALEREVNGEVFHGKRIGGVICAKLNQQVCCEQHMVIQQRVSASAGEL